MFTSKNPKEKEQMTQRLLVLLVLIGSLTVAVLPGSAVHAHHAPASKSAMADGSMSVKAAAAFRSTSVSGIGLYVYFDLYGDTCGVFTSADNNWDSNSQCRNQDEALDNDYQDPIRIYYSPNYGGAHTCLPAWESYTNLNHANQTFNSDTGAGYGQQIWKNAASSKRFVGSCTNPLPGGQYFPPGTHSGAGA
jgi:hypothetical protein